MDWFWIVLVVYLFVAVLIGLLGLFIRPLRYVFRGMSFVFVFVVEIFYIVFIWWWLSLIRLIGRRNPPRFWIFAFRR